MEEKQRIIIKIGSNITLGKSQTTNILNVDVIIRILSVVQQLHTNGHKVVLVVSGAVGAGRVTNKLTSSQAQAARGQWMLNALISQNIPQNMDVALMLLSKEDIVNRQRFLTLQETFEELLASNAVPIVNENDATSIKGKNDFPDNDHLAAILGVTIRADWLFLLTNVEGVYTGHPTHPESQLIEEITNVNMEILKVASVEGSELGRGGMIGKLQAARLATAAGVETVITSGEKPEQILEILTGTKYGTRCNARTHSDVKLSNRDRWTISSLSADGSIQVDAGAAKAVLQRRSLLAVGMKQIYGAFASKDVVEIMNHEKETIGVGRVCCDSKELAEVAGQNEKPFNMQIVHADDIILI